MGTRNFYLRDDVERKLLAVCARQGLKPGEYVANLVRHHVERAVVLLNQQVLADEATADLAAVKLVLAAREQATTTHLAEGQRSKQAMV